MNELCPLTRSAFANSAASQIAQLIGQGTLSIAADQFRGVSGRFLKNPLPTGELLLEVG